MRFLALATDYDGTLATEGAVDDETVAALRRLSATGRRLLLVTGRQLNDLLRVFPDARIFDAVVAENGAVVYRPASNESRVLGPPPDSRFVETLRRRGVDPLWLGQVVVATVEPNDRVAVDVIRELGLDLQVILNKGSVMVLPASVDKATGLRAALDELGLDQERVVAIGDAENDQAFLASSGYGVAVANALEPLKARARHVTRGEAGAGVREIIDWLIAEDLRPRGADRGQK
jgi:hydroxymethylpyrimidine pyrophosphatase-like HAD family hydrolase